MKVLISGGGTGGHIFPALSIANAMCRLYPDTEILFVGASGRMEMERVPEAGYKIVGLPVAGFDRRRLWRNFAVLAKLYKSMRMAKKVLRDFDPDICIGVGGYASGPMLKEAQKKGIPTLLQEQNSYAGVTNKLLARKAKAICVAYEGMERFFPAETITLTGNPVRKNIIATGLNKSRAKEQMGFDPERPLVAVVGGSLGARTLNDSMKAGLEAILESGASVLWQTGKFYADECAEFEKQFRRNRPDITEERLQITPFISRMDLVYSGADLLVSRAGASTISELQIVGMPAILVPSPNVAEDHQRKNAEALTRRGAAVMVLDADARAKLAGEVVRLLADEEARAGIASNVAAMALPGADEIIARKAHDIAANSLRPLRHKTDYSTNDIAHKAQQQ